ncbi:unnamed protein product [Urochloa humidicola]
MAARRIAAAPAADPPFPDELLEEIFLRLGGAADLARASAACASFRRVATARPFLRRFFRSLRHRHAPPPALGFLNHDGFHPASRPLRSAPAAAALARAADFDFSFLPEPRTSWDVADARRHDGLVLLSRRITDADDAFTDADDLADLFVCDPLFRRHVVVPPIPDDLAASIPRRDRGRFTSFLAPAGKEGGDRSPLFSVICAAVDSESKAVAFVFRSGAGGGNGEWRRIANHSSRSSPLPQILFNAEYQRSYAHGCFYWIIVDSIGGSCYSLVLDTREMKFTTTIDLPPLPPYNSTPAIVEAGEEGMLGLLTFDHRARTICLSRWTRRDNNGVGGADEEWQLYKTVPFPQSFSGQDYGCIMALGAADVYLLVLGRQFMIPYSRCCHYYTLDLKTLLLERIYASLRPVIQCSHIYARFPPLLAPPSI